MDVITDEVIERVKRIRKHTNWSQEEMAKKIGTSQSVVSKWLAGKNKPFREHADKVNEIYKSLFPDANDPLAVKDRELSDLVGSIEYKPMSSANKVFAVPDAVEGAWTLPPHISSRMSRSVRALPMIGDSMEPTIPRGSTVFIDQAQRVLASNDLYAIESGGGYTIKRLDVMPDGSSAQIISDNRQVYGEPKVVELASLNVLGRVVAIFSWRD